MINVKVLIVKKNGTLNAPGYGNNTSKLVMIGQSLCGEKCIKSQIPFTGGSGVYLDQAFKQANILKSDIFITNIVKCHPQKNRKSLFYEINNCIPYLRKELELISPNHIICFGQDASKYFDKNYKVSTSKDIVLNKKITTIHYLYHPSYIMRWKKKEEKKYVKKISTIISSCMA